LNTTSEKSEPTGFATYRLHRALKLHLTTDYDFLKYDGCVPNITYKKFDSEKMKYHYAKFETIHNLSEIPKYILANLMIQPNIQAVDFLTPEFKKNYLTYCGRRESMKYTYLTDLRSLFPKGDQTNDIEIQKVICDVGTLKGVSPPIISEVISRRISPESFIILDHIFGICKKMDLLGVDCVNPLWRTYKKRILKYKMFFVVDDINTFVNITKDYLGPQINKFIDNV